jgi:hypothetical protein
MASTLESIVTRYRRDTATQSVVNTELEVRILGVDYKNFETIYNIFLKSSSGKIKQMVGVIMINNKTRGEGVQKALMPSKIREINFENGVKVGEQWVIKEPLTLPWRVNNQSGLSYLVALSSERNAEYEFVSDETAIIRIKARVSFLFEMKSCDDSHESAVNIPWRIDMTVIRKITGSDAESSLDKIIKEMFGRGKIITPQNFLQSLNLVDEDSPYRHLYTYEIEAEFIPQARDVIRPGDVTNIANFIIQSANPDYIHDASLQSEIFNLAKYLVKDPALLSKYQRDYGLNRLLPQVIALTRVEYRKMYPPKNYFVTEKADGIRGIAIVRGRRAFILADKIYELANSPAGSAVINTNETILDGELIMDAQAFKFFAFDVLVYNGNDLTQLGFEKRQEYFAPSIDILRECGVDAHAKKFAHIIDILPENIEKNIKSIYESDHPYEIDGLIIVESGKSYMNTTSYKWKPISHNTIDMLAKKAPAHVIGKIPFINKPGYTMYFMFVGINNEMYSQLGIQMCPGYGEIFKTESTDLSRNYFPIQFSPSDVPLAYVYYYNGEEEINGKVIEMRCSAGETGTCIAAGGAAPMVNWEFVKVRRDKAGLKNYFGNDFRTAEMVWLNYVDPFPIEELWNGLGSNYFRTEKSGIYRAQTAMTNFVKSLRITELLTHANWVVDIGAGKGQDLARFLEADVRNLVAVDEDRSAISELVRRKYKFVKRFGSARSDRGLPPQKTYSTKVHAIVANVSAPFSETIQKISLTGTPSGGIDAMVCNLAVHYFCSSVENIRNFVNLARGLVKIGGHVILTIINGERVHNLFKTTGIPVNGVWDVIEGDIEMVKKYSIRRMYSSTNLEAAGQKIALILPFSDGQYYEEYLVNPKTFLSEFKRAGFTCTENTSVMSYLKEFESRRLAIASLLTPGDLKWLDLYGELIFKREK